MISRNPHIFEKKLWSELGLGDPIRVLRCRDETHEATRVISEIVHHRFRHRTDYRDYAILYRGNYQSRLFEQALREHHIPYLLSGGHSFFERSEIKDVMAYLRLLANPKDDGAFLRVVNTPRREIGPVTLEHLSHYAGQRQVSLLTACEELGLESHLPPQAVARLRHFAQWLRTLADGAHHHSPQALVESLIAEVGYPAWLTETSSGTAQAERRLKGVMDFVSWLGRLSQSEEGEERSLGEVAARLSLLGILERGAEEGEGDGVRLMTLHGAKGLEFPHVFLVGVEEDLLPHYNSQESGFLEEERRLTYVGITRAQRSLTLTLAARRSRQGEKQECSPSRFLAELPSEDLAWEGLHPEADPAARLERGRAHLDHLRSQILNKKPSAITGS